MLLNREHDVTPWKKKAAHFQVNHDKQTWDLSQSKQSKYPVQFFFSMLVQPNNRCWNQESGGEMLLSMKSSGFEIYTIHIYPLVNKHSYGKGFTHLKEWFSIAMLAYHRVYIRIITNMLEYLVWWNKLYQNWECLPSIMGIVNWDFVGIVGFITPIN